MGMAHPGRDRDRTDAMLDEFEAECEPFRKTTLRAWVDRWICEHDDAIYAITG